MAKSKQRDDFKAKIKRELADRASNLCSKPGCQNLTKGARAGAPGSAGVGVAAHISAASEGGPRYNPDLTPEQRSDYQNGVWLCQTCSVLIDSDALKYPVTTLVQWRNEAEAYSNANLGKPLYDASTVRKECIKSVVEHATGDTISSSTQLAVEALNINNTELSRLDPRFDITTNIVNSKVNIFIVPKDEIVTISIEPVGSDGVLYESLESLIEEGKEFSIPTDQIKASGSALFDRILSEPGGVLSARPKIVKIQCQLYASNKNTELLICSFNASMFGGTNLITIEGMALNKFLHFSSKISDINYSSFTVCTKSWLNKKISVLPFFHKLERAAAILHESGVLKVVHDDSERGEVKLGQTDPEGVNPLIEHLVSVIRYVSNARIVNNYFKANLTFQHFNIPVEQIKALDEICELIEKPKVITSEQVTSNIKTNVLLHKDFCAIATSPIGKSNMNIIINPQGTLLTLFNQPIPKYFISYEFTDVTLLSKDELIPGTEIELEIEMNEGSQCIKSLHKQNPSL
ncbi:hypothetical protein H5181_09065 [Shewanella sp. SG44-2]|uniref:hypothetical protein n=1 Tax=Shewanella sp. SG44-2 TaxID=2760962 RepID=UPI001603D4A4|nr:hypothetical protein [Shewanella sp. SG44-2]MBB1426611.1 hypothetical protein [Shewanella sp. SG44-2]